MLSASLIVGAVSLPTTVISFILVLGILVFAHELGHYLAAKSAGVRVEEFALGFGPKLFKFRKGETLYSLRGFPLGGFCKMTGEFPHAEKELEGEELISYQEAVAQGRALHQKNILQRFLVFFMGPFMNFFLAALILSLVFAVNGVPIEGSDTPRIGVVEPGRPAYKAGLEEGDQVLSINGQPVESWEDISPLIAESESNTIHVSVERDGVQKDFVIEADYDQEQERRIIGIWAEVITEKVGLLTALKTGISETWYMIKTLVVAFWNLITFQTPGEVGGPVAIAKMVGEATEVGWVYLLNFMAMLSVNLGIINLIPFPALDGGRILFLGVELVRGRPVDPEKEGFAHFIGFVILMVLIVFIMYKDIAKIF